MTDRPDATNRDDANALSDFTGTPLWRRLESHRAMLLRFVSIRGGGLLRHESAEDLVQGIHLRAMTSDTAIAERGEDEFLAWMQVVARRHIADRHDYWSAMRRHASQILRVSAAAGPTGDGPRGVDPAMHRTGPATFAERREQIELMTRLLDDLPTRDREILRAVGKGTTIEDLADSLKVSYQAAEIAKRRALDRLRRAFTAATGREPA